MNQLISLDIPDETILFERSAGLKTIILNRPERLHALSLEMIRMLSYRFKRAAIDSDISAVLLEATGGKAFCAGGDVKQAHDNGMLARRGDTDIAVAHMFFSEEYALNGQIAAMGKPVISYLNGICMGGGYGLAGNGTHIVVNENTQFAMPEVTIGLFPDVGAALPLINAPHCYGVYLALTGRTINGADMLEAGLAHACVSAARYERFKVALLDCTRGHCERAHIDGLLAQFDSRITLDDGHLLANQDKIETCFSLDTVEAMMAWLQGQGDDPWAQETLRCMQAACPVSLKVTLRHLQIARGQSINEVLLRDDHLSMRFIESHHFYEGVRAAVIDKDKNPSWDPDTIEAVDETMLDWYFNK